VLRAVRAGANAAECRKCRGAGAGLGQREQRDRVQNANAGSGVWGAECKYRVQVQNYRCRVQSAGAVQVQSASHRVGSAALLHYSTDTHKR
jgi:hypothetical protein